MGHPNPIKIIIIEKCPKLLRIYGKISFSFAFHVYDKNASNSIFYPRDFFQQCGHDSLTNDYFQLCGHDTMLVSSAAQDALITPDPVTATMSEPVFITQNGSKEEHPSTGEAPPPNGDSTATALGTTPNQPILMMMASPQQPKSLQHEFSLVNMNIPHVTVDEVSTVVRYHYYLELVVSL